VSDFDTDFDEFLTKQGLDEDELTMDEFHEQLEDFNLQSSLEREKQNAALASKVATAATTEALSAAQTQAKELGAALQTATTDPERERINKEYMTTAALIGDLETALPFEGQDDDALAASLEDREVTLEEARETFAQFKTKESDPSLPRSARYRRAERAERDALAAVVGAKNEQRRRQDKSAYVKASEQLLASMTARKVEDLKAVNMNELRKELWGRVSVAEGNFLLEQRRRELEANTPPEFVKQARQEAEAEYQSRLEADALVVADQHLRKV
jgi:hypothetical protein